jgi:hypothetical protein
MILQMSVRAVGALCDCVRGRSAIQARLPEPEKRWPVGRCSVKCVAILDMQLSLFAKMLSVCGMPAAGRATLVRG